MTHPKDFYRAESVLAVGGELALRRCRHLLHQLLPTPPLVRELSALVRPLVLRGADELGLQLTKTEIGVTTVQSVPCPGGSGGQIGTKDWPHCYTLSLPALAGSWIRGTATFPPSVCVGPCSSWTPRGTSSRQGSSAARCAGSRGGSSSFPPPT